MCILMQTQRGSIIHTPIERPLLVLSYLVRAIHRYSLADFNFRNFRLLDYAAVRVL
jgi:hypothetical protein